MLALIYHLSWYLAAPVLRLAAAVGAALRRARAGRVPGGFAPDLAERLDPEAGAAPGRPPPTLWIHCASLGEAKGVAGMLGGLPGPWERVLLTAATGTGRDFLRQEAACIRRAGGKEMPAFQVRLAPLDHLPVLRAFLAAQNVRCLCLYEMELWPGCLRACRDRGVPVVLAAARLSALALAGIRRHPSPWMKLLRAPAWIQAQGPRDLERFQALGLMRAEPGFDFRLLHFMCERRSGIGNGIAGAGPSLQASAPGRGVQASPWPEGGDGGFAFISLHLAELRRLLPSLKTMAAEENILIFPRHLSELPRFWDLLGPLDFRPFPGNPHPRLLVTCLGLVSRLLPFCRACFVGGSLINRGCHNLWEPFLAGLRIHFGPHYANQELLAEHLLKQGFGESLRDPGLLPLTARKAGRLAPEAVSETSGEMRRTAVQALERCRTKLEELWRHAGDGPEQDFPGHSPPAFGDPVGGADGT